MTMTPLPVRARPIAAALAFAVLWSGIGLAQSKPAGKPVAVAGTYTGWIRGASEGDGPLTVKLAQDGATFTGTMDAGPYSFTISDGKVDGEKLTWVFSSTDITGTVSGTCQAGAIAGSWSAMGVESGTIELKKSADN